jgi:hypothetical protein
MRMKERRCWKLFPELRVLFRLPPPPPTAIVLVSDVRMAGETVHRDTYGDWAVGWRRGTPKGREAAGLQPPPPKSPKPKFKKHIL